MNTRKGCNCDCHTFGGSHIVACCGDDYYENHQDEIEQRQLDAYDKMMVESHKHLSVPRPKRTLRQERERMKKLLQPAMDAIDESEKITEKDLAIRVK